ncbi:MAG TPA: RNA polymerase sigma factor, partial [Candidatus Synoicihabitans sp.]|nr:RNA polymerase sigma factor [Candidatus Synoicihabitans sp.]
MTYVDRPAGFTTTAMILPTADDELALVQRAQARDERAFAQLYRLHVPRVYAVCFRILANAHRAEETTQRVFITAWRDLPRFRGESAFASWLHRVAVNTVLSELRAEQRRLDRVAPAISGDLPEIPATLARPGTRLDLEQAIAALPPQARAIFVLQAVEGYR